MVANTSNCILSVSNNIIRLSGLSGINLNGVVTFPANSYYLSGSLVTEVTSFTIQKPILRTPPSISLTGNTVLKPMVCNSSVVEFNIINPYNDTWKSLTVIPTYGDGTVFSEMNSYYLAQTSMSGANTLKRYVYPYCLFGILVVNVTITAVSQYDSTVSLMVQLIFASSYTTTYFFGGIRLNQMVLDDDGALWVAISSGCGAAPTPNCIGTSAGGIRKISFGPTSSSPTSVYTDYRFNYFYQTYNTFNGFSLTKDIYGVLWSIDSDSTCGSNIGNAACYRLAALNPTTGVVTNLTAQSNMRVTSWALSPSNDGNIYWCDLTGVGKINTNNGSSWLIANPGSCVGIVAHPVSGIFFHTHDSKVYRMFDNGTYYVYVNYAATVNDWWPSRGLSIDSYSNLYIAQSTTNTIKMISNNLTYFTIAGTGTVGTLDGDISKAQFNSPKYILSDSNNNLFVTEIGTDNSNIRRVILFAVCGNILK
jgi:hypothetical protein